MTSSIALVWLAVSISCSGHVNAKCDLVVETFTTKDECVAKLLWRKTVNNAMCIPLAGEPFLPKNGIVKNK